MKHLNNFFEPSRSKIDKYLYLNEESLTLWTEHELTSLKLQDSKLVKNKGL